jgi:hypothetical protein
VAAAKRLCAVSFWRSLAGSGHSFCQWRRLRSKSHRTHLEVKGFPPAPSQRPSSETSTRTGVSHVTTGSHRRSCGQTCAHGRAIAMCSSSRSELTLWLAATAACHKVTLSQGWSMVSMASCAAFPRLRRTRRCCTCCPSRQHPFLSRREAALANALMHQRAPSRTAARRRPPLRCGGCSPGWPLARRRRMRAGCARRRAVAICPAAAPTRSQR